jgi:2-dehydro-3-deoxyphosphogluconate aldolase/(4S)-4-hydroxy-2-oxoglutarate aldolase
VNNRIPIVPGVCTPTEIEAALEYGLDVLKFFPAESMGGIKSLKAFSGPYSKVKFIPTGGINTTNVCDYLNLPNVLACGGSWMVSKKLISSRNYTEIARLTREAVLLCNNI